MDWKAHIESLLSAGASYNQIANLIGGKPNALREIVAGRTKEPRGSCALKLASLMPVDFSRPPRDGEAA